MTPKLNPQLGPKLGKVRKVRARHVWPNEALNFTPWLASPEGLALLRGALEMDLEVTATEQFIGPFKADIVARRTDTADEHWVLVENQLERTDHRHLGQLLTYAAGRKAATIVWVAEHFCEEHRAALGWLNAMTSDALAFYGLEVELWQIGNSPPAPMFTVTVKPSHRSRELTPKTNRAVTDFKQLQLRYWHELRVKLLAKNSQVRPNVARAEHRAQYALGRGGTWLSATINMPSTCIAVELIVEGPAGKVWFRELEAQKAAIDREFGPGLSWQILDGKKRSRITLYRQQTDVTDEADWPAQHAWMVEALEKFHSVFQPRVLSLSAGTGFEPRSNGDDS